MEDNIGLRSRRLASGSQCPICNRFFSHEAIVSHADACARRLEPKHSDQPLHKKYSAVSSLPGRKSGFKKHVNKPSAVNAATRTAPQHRVKTSVKKSEGVKRKFHSGYKHVYGAAHQAGSPEDIDDAFASERDADYGTDEDYIEGFRISSQSLKPWMHKVKSAPRSGPSSQGIQAKKIGGQGKKHCPQCRAKLAPRAGKCPCGHVFTFYHGSSICTNSVPDSELEHTSEVGMQAQRSKTMQKHAPNGFSMDSSSEEESDEDVDMTPQSVSQKVEVNPHKDLHHHLQMQRAQLTLPLSTENNPKHRPKPSLPGMPGSRELFSTVWNESIPSSKSIEVVDRGHTGVHKHQKRPFKSPQARPQWNTQKGMSVQDAAHFLDKVKMAFSKQPKMHSYFLDIMTGFKASTLGTQEVMEQVSELFKDHPDLIADFNNFLPAGYHIHLLPPHLHPYRSARTNFQDAHNLAVKFLHQVKESHSDQGQYLKFMQILQQAPIDSPALQHTDSMWSDQELLQFKVVKDKVDMFLKDCPKLREEFKEFLPHSILQVNTPNSIGYVHEVVCKNGVA